MQIDDDIALDLAKNERIREMQEFIIMYKDKIKKIQSDYSEEGWDYEVRNIEDALYSANQPIEELTEAQITRIKWLIGLMD